MACPDYKTSDELIACAQLHAIYDEKTVSVYADRTGAQGGHDNWVRTYTIACLRTNRIIYWQKSPGDCQGEVRNAGSVGTSLAAAGIKAGLSAVPIAGPILSAVANFLPFAHHAVAVQNEHQILCDVAVNYNAFADSIASALQNKQIALQDAKIQANQVFDSLRQEASQIAHPYNASYGVVSALDALKLMNIEAIYPILVPGVLESVLQSKTGLGAVIVGGGVVGAKLLGFI